LSVPKKLNEKGHRAISKLLKRLRLRYWLMLTQRLGKHEQQEWVDWAIRKDGTTAAQRLFDKQFPDLFEWVALNMGDLPRARRTLNPKISRKPAIQFVPA
jgi:hypothetical protein